MITGNNVGREGKGNKCDDVRDDVRACRYALLDGDEFLPGGWIEK